MNIAIKAVSQAGQLSQAGQGNCSENTIALLGTIATKNFRYSEKKWSKMVSNLSILHQRWFRMNSTDPNL